MSASFHTKIRNYSSVTLLIASLALALPIENLIPSVWIWPFFFVGLLGILLYFVIYFAHSRGR